MLSILSLSRDLRCREIQPLETRAAGAGINVAVNMLFTFIIGQCFTTMLCSMRYGVFLFFAGVEPCMSSLALHNLPVSSMLYIQVQVSWGLLAQQQSRVSVSHFMPDRRSRPGTLEPPPVMPA